MAVVGIDIGSIWAKVVLLEDKQIKASLIQPTGMHMLEAADKIFHEVCKKAEISPAKVGKTVATGYGRTIIPWATRSSCPNLKS